MLSSAQLQRLLQEAVAHHRAGRLAQAEELYQRVRVAAPRNFDALHLSGVIALQQGRATDAANLLARARKLDPKSAVCTMRYGLALISQGQTAEAEKQLRRALELDPGFVEGWDNLAYCLKTQDRLPEAIECHVRAVTLKPDYAAGWYNYGLTLSLAGRIGEALQCHDRALAADPKYPNAHYGRAQALQQAHRLDEAIAAYDCFLALEPGHHEARGYRLFALNYCAKLPREKLFAEHLEFGRLVGQKPLPAFAQLPDPDRCLQVAILSPDLRTHSCAYFLEPLLRHLDGAAFEVHLFHDHFHEDAVSGRLQQLAKSWRNVVGQPGPAVEQAIRDCQPDLVIDLAGHTGMTNRLPLFAQHLAPIQISFLGYPNTTGVPAIGYRLTDSIADPVGEADEFATEKLVRFARTAWAYQPPAEAPAVNELPAAKPGSAITFGCFNNLIKITDEMLGVWGRLLHTVPDSRLVLKGRGLDSPAVRQRYLARFTACGIPCERVDLLERTTCLDDHLTLYHRVDVALDTFPYHGTTTTCEALWMGVPVVTLAGDRHASRVGASLLRAVNHGEWVAPSPDDYVRIAADLALDRRRLQAARAGLRAEMSNSPLLDHAGQAAHFGAALRLCWREWCQSQSARNVALEPEGQLSSAGPVKL